MLLLRIADTLIAVVVMAGFGFVAAAAAQVRYQSCVGRADETYHATWATSCKRVAEQTLKDRETCTYSKELCNSVYQPRDPSANCALPKQSRKT